MIPRYTWMINVLERLRYRKKLGEGMSVVCKQINQ